MTVTRANVDFWWQVAAPRNNKRYGYGGNWSATNPDASTDCSGIVSFVCAAVSLGPTGWRWTRWPYSTESWRAVEVGQRGPFGTICVARPEDIPADAAVKIGCMHGGGGPNSHMACTLMDRPGGINIESSGNPGGQRWGGTARGYNDPIFHDWHYLPGPIVGSGGPVFEIPADPNAVTWGIDISNHQGVMDLDRVKAEGFDFVFGKVSEGAGYRDPFWARTRDDAKRLGLILAGYHYIREGDPVAQAATFVGQLGDKSIPAMLDFEANSGPMSQFWAVKAAIEMLGVTVRLSYIPDWYWQQIGEPDLSKVPGLIRSEYVPGTGYASVLYPGNDSALWGSYGGRTPDILQFTDKASVAGKSVDANAFRGTPAQLRSLLATGTTTTTTPLDPLEELLMSNLELQSWSAYAAKGEAKIPAAQMVQAIDREADEARTERRARRGDPESLTRIARTAKGLGQYTDAATVNDAIATLASIGGKTVAEVKELLKG